MKTVELDDLCFSNSKIHEKSILKSEKMINTEFHVEVTSGGGRGCSGRGGMQWTSKKTGIVIFLKWVMVVCFNIYTNILFSCHNKYMS